MGPSRLALLGAGLCLGLALGEGLLALLAPQVRRTPRLWQFDPVLGWAHVPGAVGRMVSPEFAVDVKISPDGWRDRQVPLERTAGGWRLAALGDSFVEGWGVPLEASVAKQLEDRLRDRGWPQAEVLNLGIAGYGTDQELLLFESQGARYRPDDVLVFFYANDLWNNASQMGIGSEQGFKPYYRLEATDSLVLCGVPVPRLPTWDDDYERRAPWRWRLDRQLRRRLHTYALLQETLIRQEDDLGQRQRFYEALYGLDPGGRWQAQWELSGRLLGEFGRAVRRAGARLHVVSIPAMVQIDDAAWERTVRRDRLAGGYDRQKPGRQLASFAARYGFQLLDLYPAFREQAAHQTLYLRDSHWNQAGHALAARTIAAWLAAGAAPPASPGRNP